MDASHYGNEVAPQFVVDRFFAQVQMRFINDYRGISSKYNIHMKSKVVRDLWHGPVITTRRVLKGEEILADYGPGYCKSFGIELGSTESEDEW